MASKLDVPLHETSLSIVRRCGPALGDVLQTKFGCVASFDGMDFDGDLSTAQQRRPAVVPERRFDATLPGGVQVSVWKADLTGIQVDAVVNAANVFLQHSGGLARALSNAGGPQIQSESNDYIRRCGHLKTGDAVVLDAGLLPCKKIIHAVGPDLPMYASNQEVLDAEQKLKKVINNILDRVKEFRLQSVAIPAISSGLFHYPLTQCAITIVKTVKRYYESSYSAGHLPKEVLLMNHDEPTVREMEKACRQILATRVGGAKTSTTTVQLGNVHLTLKTGKIEEQQTDVIVNTMSLDRDLSSGQVSSALLKRAGRNMQQDIKNAPQTGSVIITKSYMLPCKEVYHTCCTEQGRGEAKQILSKSVLECLGLAASSHHKSISLPAIGTGGLGFGKKEAAEIMSQAVFTFAQSVPRKMDVYFVIFPSDNNTFKAFEGQMGILQRTASHSSFTHAVDVMMSSPPVFEHRGNVRGAGGGALTPQISLNGPSEETTREAERWLSDRLSNSSGAVTICNNFIQHFGEQEYGQLTRLSKRGVSIEEFFQKGRAGIIVRGDSGEDVVVAGLQVEAMLCNIQREFTSEEEGAMLNALMTNNMSFERKTVDNGSPEFWKKSSIYTEHKLRILRVERVENLTLEKLFEMKKNQLHCSTPPQTMLQRIPAQFCQMVSHVGFHAEIAPPDEPLYGEGIYFAGDVQTALQVWSLQDELREEFVYLVEAEVLTGSSTAGSPGLFLPPAVGAEPHMAYDSVSGGTRVSVIFSGYQALPRYILTCKLV